MKLRKATFNDWKVLLDWRNDPLTRKNSFTQEIIKEENHKKWFKKNLIGETSNLFILETETNEPVGTIRSDKTDNNSYLLSWNISPHHRKKGYGSLILNLFLQNKIGIFTAEIKSENLASIKMVEKNGFKRVNEQTYIKKL
jgi:RimJ/RimL family protein N-acetyltransferase